MGKADHQITLYTAQRDAVVALLAREDYWVQKRYIDMKYGEVAHIFTTVYGWYARQAEKIVARPPQAESAVWAFADRSDVGVYEGSRLLTLRVPVDQGVFFDMMDWTELLNFRYLGSHEQKAAFAEKLAEQGVADEMQVMTTGFYPLLRRELTASWSGLLRHDSAIKAGHRPISHIQVGLWGIRRDWIVSVD